MYDESPARPPETPRYLVPAGTPCSVSRETPRWWRCHVTSVDLAFDQCWGRDGDYLVFLRGEHLIKVYGPNVRFRDAADVVERQGVGYA